jgi:hypothetical protein
VELPNDDAGRGDLAELLALSLPKNRSNVVEVWAPWLPDDEARLLIDNIGTFDINTSPKALGQRLRLTYAERERLGIRQIAPCDITKEELAERRKAQRQARGRARRRQRGARPRQEYLASSRTKAKPWLAEGISRRTWYRRQSKVGTSPRPKQTRIGTGPLPKQKSGGTGPRPINSYSQKRTCANVESRSKPSQQSLKPTPPHTPPPGGETPRSGVSTNRVGSRVIEALLKCAPQSGELIIDTLDGRKRLYRDEHGQPQVEDCPPTDPVCNEVEGLP